MKIFKENSSTSRLATTFAGFMLLSACAATTPQQLTDARAAYQRASTGPAAQHNPVDVHKAKTALDAAEKNFAEEEDSQKTVDLAYIAERTAQIAEARADAAMAEKQRSQATQTLGDTKDKIAAQREGELAQTREQLSASERDHAVQAQKTATERLAREHAEKNAAASAQDAAASAQKAAAAELAAKEANDALAKLAAKEEERGMVITLSGSVLFRSNKSELMPGAQKRLDQVAEALAAKDRDVVVEGHTDSQGKQANNMELSQRRAESVRTYLISRGLPAEKIQARGMGPDRPIAENTNAEGRANNRRVEIVISKVATAAR